MSRSRRLYLPMIEPADVKRHLGAEYQCQPGRSAWLIAKAWFEANDLPHTIRGTLTQSHASLQQNWSMPF
jgi:hypothetical protein